VLAVFISTDDVDDSRLLVVVDRSSVDVVQAPCRDGTVEPLALGPHVQFELGAMDTGLLVPYDLAVDGFLAQTELLVGDHRWFGGSSGIGIACRGRQCRER